MPSRQGPTESAKNFSIGTKKRGNDGNMWVIIQTKTSKRWSKVNKTKKASKANNQANNKTQTNKIKKKDISLDKLRQLLKKYNASFSGSKENIAQGLFRLRNSTIESNDLELIYNLLDNGQKKRARQLMQDRISKPITNYKGMYEPNTKPISSMTRDELIKRLQKFRNSWEKNTTRNQDLSDERLNNETTDELRKLIKFYYSDSAKLLAEEWLRNYKR